MPITFTFDLETEAHTDDRARMRLAFRRLGWESLGGSAWRYPALARQGEHEDWMNHVVPALMYFKALVLTKNLTVTSYSLDTHASTGLSTKGSTVGSEIAGGDHVQLFKIDAPGEKNDTAKLSEKTLRRKLKKFEAV